MATVLLAAAGAAFGAGFGGTVLGVSAAVIGRAVGATVGRAIDQRLMGLGSEAVDVGRVDRFRVMGASEGTAIPRTWGRMRLPGQVIWASPFKETSVRSGGGKGVPKPRTVQFSYTVSLAIALCEGEILGVGRIWADGAEIEPRSFDMRVYKGTRDQMPDPALEAELGVGMAPSFRDTAYVVIENMDLSPFGSRVPQLSFEVIRQANVPGADGIVGYDKMIRAVALIPGTGEYALATERVNIPVGLKNTKAVNVNSRAGVPNFVASFDQLKQELPKCEMISLVVSWFGNDLRCGQCTVQPKVEQKQTDSVNMPWTAGGIARAAASVVPTDAGRPIYGGTPADASVLQAIQATHAAGRKIMFYPFILMEQTAGNELADPYGNALEQPALPWRGRITLSVAPGLPGSPDLTDVADTQVNAFFGTSQISDFSIESGEVKYTGPSSWTYRRFILHYAHLCKLAGGVDAFCIGSELRGLTQIRGEGHSFPAIAALRQLAADVRLVLGQTTKISYAADWSEYFGYHADGNVYFHLDPLWSDANIDFVGIDNYMPLSDWRDEPEHADSAWKSVENIDYLKAGVCGGEGYDWYYDGDERRNAQLRSAIKDHQYGEDWIFRYKDLRSWWENLHHDRIDGNRSDIATDWVPGSKPIWFTEYGCAAVDKATNEPNKFLDEKSSESSLPAFSTGSRNDYLQFQYYRAMHEYWNDPANNPESSLYAGRMLDTERLFAWAWDARPYPEFPRNEDLWSDGTNYWRGHWLNGRVSANSLSNIVQELCADTLSGEVDTHDLHGIVSGYVVSDIESVRSTLQPLGISFGFDAIEGEGTIRFVSRGLDAAIDLRVAEIAMTAEQETSLELTRLAEAEIIGRCRLVYISSDGDFSAKVAESSSSDENAPVVSQSEFSIAMTDGQAKSIVGRWLAEARTNRDIMKVRLPASACDVKVGSVLSMAGLTYRVDRVETDTAQMIEAVRVEKSQYRTNDSDSEGTAWSGYTAPSPVFPVWMDIPLLTGSEVPHAPHIATTAMPLPGTVAVWSSDQDDGYALIKTCDVPAIIGTTLSQLQFGRAGLFDRQAALRVELMDGVLSSCQVASVLNGANTIAIGDGSPENWEVIQFQNAEIVGDKQYDLSVFLRGQAGSDSLASREWPAGSTVVLLDSAVSQIPLQSSFRNLSRHYRIGNADLGYADESVTHEVLSFRGIGQRPYRVAHLAARVDQSGDCHVSWIRRTRVDGDSWDSFEVPLGEGSELYQVTLIADSGEILRSEVTTAPSFVYTAAQQNADAISAPFGIEVAQISESYGVGPSARIDVF